MTDSTVTDRILGLYASAFPKHLSGRRLIGCEEEYIIVDRAGRMGNTSPIFQSMVEDGWAPKFDPITHALIGAVKDGIEYSMEVGVGTLEIGFTPIDNLSAHAKVSSRTLRELDTRLARFGLVRLTDYATQPITHPARDHWSAKARAHFFRDYFPESVHVQTASASSQLHVDVTLSELLPVLEILLAFSPVMTALSANSPIWGGNYDEYGILAARQDFWNRFTKRSKHRFNVRLADPWLGSESPEAVPGSVDQLASWIGMIPFIIHVDGTQLITPNTSFQEWCATQHDLSDDTFVRAFQSHEGTLWWEVRPRVRYGTIEVRPNCQGRNAIAMHALVLGLVENWQAVHAFIRRHPYLTWRSLQLPALIDGLRSRDLPDLTAQALAFAKTGLAQRGLGEEIFLAPLYRQLASRSSPAHAKCERYAHRGMDGLLEMLMT